jgi:hypothetical protein
MLKTFLFWPRFLMGAPAVGETEARKIIDDCVAMFLSHYAHSGDKIRKGSAG